MPCQVLANTVGVDGELIERREVVGLLWSVYDIAESVKRIEKLLEDDDGEEEADA